MSDDAGSLDALYAAWADAFSRRDVNAVVRLLTPDYLLFSPGAPPMGVEELRPRIAAAFAAYDISSAFERDERVVAGDIAFERGWDVQTVRPQEGGETVTRRQRVFVLLRRDQDGTWRFARGMSQPGPPP